jgi:hypothetical protein
MLDGETAATMLAMSWTHLRGRLIQPQRVGATEDDAQPPGRYERRLLTKFSAMELPSPPSSGIRIQAHR